MRERARDKGRLEDIIEYSDNVSKFISGHTFETFVADKRTYYSMMKNVELPTTFVERGSLVRQRP